MSGRRFQKAVTTTAAAASVLFTPFLMCSQSAMMGELQSPVKEKHLRVPATPGQSQWPDLARFVPPPQGNSGASLEACRTGARSWIAARTARLFGSLVCASPNVSISPLSFVARPNCPVFILVKCTFPKSRVVARTIALTIVSTTAPWSVIGLIISR
eukprot:114055-Rhodomonas_salina.1